MVMLFIGIGDYGQACGRNGGACLLAMGERCSRSRGSYSIVEMYLLCDTIHCNHCIHTCFIIRYINDTKENQQTHPHHHCPEPTAKSTLPSALLPPSLLAIAATTILILLRRYISLSLWLVRRGRYIEPYTHHAHHRSKILIVSANESSI